MKMNEEFDETFINHIKNQAEELEIPASLEPDSMMRKLRRKKRFRSISVYQIAVSAILCVAAIGVFYLSPVVNQEIFRDGVAVADNGVKTASSYSEIEDILKGFKNSYSPEDMMSGSLESYAESDNAITADSAKSTGSSYSDTNIQVSGVDEGDIVKTDGSYLYIANQNELGISIVKADAENSIVVGKIDLTSENTIDNYWIQEMYIQNDILSVVVTGNYLVNGDVNDENSYEFKEYTILNTYDISDRSNPKLEGTVKQDGYYHSSRKVGDIIYLLTNYYPTYEFSHLVEEDCIPSVNGKQLKPDSIYVTDDAQTSSYLIISSVNVNKPSETVVSKAMLSSCDTFYMSNKNIYIANTIWSREDQNTDETEILKFQYDTNGNIESIANVKIQGTILDSFSMDEYDGNLRVVTTVNHYEEETSAVTDAWTSDIVSISSTETNSLYILDENLKRLGSIEGLAEDERVYSARFMGDIGYFVTYHQTDPLFAVDLSDPTNPKILCELKIPGFSNYLHFWSDNLLLGIGKETGTDGNEGVKLSMFDISNPENVTEVSKYVIDKSWYSPTLYNHKAVLIDSVKNLIGFMVEGEDQVIDSYSSTWKSDYVVFSYDSQNGFELKLRENLYTNNGTDYMDCSGTRGLYIDDDLYIVNPEQEIKVFGLSDFQLKGVLNLLN